MSFFSIICALFDRLPPRALRFFVEYCGIRLSMAPPVNLRRKITANLKRILEHSGQDAGPERLRELIEGFIEVQTRFTMLVFLSRAELRFAREEVELPALAAVEELREEGRGVILALPHFGLSLHALFALGEELPWKIVFPRPERARHAPPWMMERLLPLGGCAAGCARALAANEVVIVPPDLNLGPPQKLTGFFGAPAPISRGPARLARLTGAPILPVYAVCRDGCSRCALEADEPIRFEPGPKGLGRTTDRLARSMERWIGRYPGQWLVGYDFWSLERIPFDYRLLSGDGWTVDAGKLQ